VNASRDLLFEIGVEELPASAARAAVGQAASAALQAFNSRNLAVEQGQVSAWVSPRRIAVFVQGLPEKQGDAESADRGPAAGVAFDEDGRPTRAAQGFARAKGVPVEKLELREHKGQQFVFAVHRVEGRPAIEVIPDACREILGSFVFSKTMRWDASGMRFSRPVRWLAARFGDEAVAFEANGLACGTTSRGHRFLDGDGIEIRSAGEYREQLRDAAVVVDQEERRQVISDGLQRLAGALGAEYFDPAGELEEVIYLVENPSVQQGSFRSEHLRLPDEVLVTAMQSHQRYFPLRDGEGGLIARFLHVINGDPAHISEITEGNERVLEGRLEDAEFSYDKDLDTGIEAMRESLTSVAFHKLLGSMADKSARLTELAAALCDLLGAESRERETAVTAAGLAKADLVSIMVQEFPTLEGHMGAAYAAIEAYPADVCHAIGEHYLPRHAGDRLPRTFPGAVLAVCDRADNLVGAFAADELPTGSRDPYGLRRAAAGIYDIVRERDLELDLSVILRKAHGLYVSQGARVNNDAAAVTAAVTGFVFDRIQQRMVEAGLPVGVVEAARAAGITSIRRLGLLAEAIEEFRGSPGFEDLHTAYFRCSKIAAKAGADAAAPIDPGLFSEEAEGLLFDALGGLEEEIDALTARDDYSAALEAAARVRPIVDRYFDDVLVMDKDEGTRRNRLALVSRMAAALQVLGDPMQAAAAPKKD